MVNLVNLLYVYWLCCCSCLFVPLVMVRPDSFPMFLIASGITSNHILLRRPLHFVEKKALKISKLSWVTQNVTPTPWHSWPSWWDPSPCELSRGRKRLAMELEGGRSKGQSKIWFRLYQLAHSDDYIISILDYQLTSIWMELDDVICLSRTMVTLQ